MRIGIIWVAIACTWSGLARADECAGAAAPTPECDAIVQLRIARGRPTDSLRDHLGMSLSIGYRSDEFDPSGRTFDVTPAGYRNTIGHFDGSRLEPMRGDGAFLDVRIHPDPRWYFGADLGVAVAAPPAAAFLAAGTDVMTWHEATLLTMAGVIGARLPLGRVSIRSELVAGVHGAVLVSGSRPGGAISAESDVPLVEPRFGVDVWPHRWWAIEAFAGVNLLDRSERIVGIGLGFHSRAFDGRY